jgi:glycosyltransferase involved in cell wall biosynthesis
MFNRFREERYINRKIRIAPAILAERLKIIRQQSDVLAICPSPTHFNWMGVNRATHNLFPESAFDLPQYFSKGIYTLHELNILALEITRLRFSKVIFNGFLGYFVEFISKIKAHNERTEISCVFHGSLSEMALIKNMSENVNLLIKLTTSGLVSKIGFVKKGLAEFFSQNYGINTSNVILPAPQIERNLFLKKPDDGVLNIGIFVNGQFRKNLFNQVAAALMIKNTLIHVFEEKGLEIFGQQHRFRYYPLNLNRENFLDILASMNINLYNTYTESWGQIVVESIVLGVPCLTNNTSGVLDCSAELKELLVVKEHDNADAYARQAEYVLKNISIFDKYRPKYLKCLKEASSDSLKSFLYG